MSKFTKEYSIDHKECYINGPFSMNISIDYDDVDRERVDK